MTSEQSSNSPSPTGDVSQKMKVSTPKVSGTIRSKNPLKGAVEILPDRLFYASLKQPPPSHNILASMPRKNKSETPAEKKQIHFFNIDNELVYWNFFLDFGPLNLGQFTRFSNKLNDKLRKFPVVCFYSNTVPAKRANAIFLICAYQILHLSRTPEEAYRGFDGEDLAAQGSNAPVSQSQGAVTIGPLPPFHDASPCACTYDLTVLDCLRGMAKALKCGFFDMKSFDVDEYEHFEQVENGDLNWIVKDKFLAFAGPSYERHVSPEGYCTLAPADYIPYFKKKNVGLVVRLNKKNYEEEDFKRAGIDHLEAFFVDGSCPPMKILYQVIEAFERVPKDKAIAVHCKAGLGRTGTCIGAYLMKHYKFTAAEVIGWMRICRPGMVIGPQQHFLEQIQDRMWAEGEAAKPIESPLESPRRRVVKRTNSNEAIEGIAGQAEGLLAARAGRRKDHLQTLPMAPITPTSQVKEPVSVTPEQGPRICF